MGKKRGYGGATPHSVLTTAVISVMYGRPYMRLRGCTTSHFHSFKVVGGMEGRGSSSALEQKCCQTDCILFFWLSLSLNVWSSSFTSAVVVQLFLFLINMFLVEAESLLSLLTLSRSVLFSLVVVVWLPSLLVGKRSHVFWLGHFLSHRRPLPARKEDGGEGGGGSCSLHKKDLDNKKQNQHHFQTCA